MELYFQSTYQIVQDLGQQFFFHRIQQEGIRQLDNLHSDCAMLSSLKGHVKKCLPHSPLDYNNILILRLFLFHRIRTLKFLIQSYWSVKSIYLWIKHMYSKSTPSNSSVTMSQTSGFRNAKEPLRLLKDVKTLLSKSRDCSPHVLGKR